MILTDYELWIDNKWTAPEPLYFYFVQEYSDKE